MLMAGSPRDCAAAASVGYFLVDQKIVGDSLTAASSSAAA